MSYFTDHPKARWIAPAAAIALIGGVSLVAGQATADDPSLPPRTAEELLVDLQEAEPTPMSGTVVATSDLGLPELPGTGGQGGPGHQGSADFSSLISGTHTLRLWYGGPERARIALVGNGAESDLIRNGRDVWLWSSAEEKAVHHTLPEDAAEHTPPGPADLPVTPEEAAELALDKLDPSTEVTTDGTASVAGRSAYELVLEPKAEDSLVDDVRIAVDAEEGIPLRVQVNSTKLDESALEVGFTELDFTAPEPRMFEFDAPPGTTVTEGDADKDALAGMRPDGSGPEKSKPTIAGSGWSSVAIMDVPPEALSGGAGEGDGSGDADEGRAMAQALESLPKVSGDWGSGHLLSGTLFSAVLTDDGRLAVGMVAPETLYDAL